jgi:anti-anti-sigma factor
LVVERGERRVVVRVSGELDLSVAGELRAALAAARTDARLVVLDLGALAFMDCAGIAVLVEERRRAEADGYDLTITGAAGEVADLLALTGLDVQLGSGAARRRRRWSRPGRR